MPPQSYGIFYLQQISLPFIWTLAYLYGYVIKNLNYNCPLRPNLPLTKTKFSYSGNQSPKTKLSTSLYIF